MVPTRAYASAAPRVVPMVGHLAELLVVRMDGTMAGHWVVWMADLTALTTAGRSVLWKVAPMADPMVDCWA